MVFMDLTRQSSMCGRALNRLPVYGGEKNMDCMLWESGNIRSTLMLVVMLVLIMMVMMMV